VIKLRQPQGIKRRKLNDDEPCSAYEIYRANSGAVLGESRRVDLGWEFCMDGASEWVLSAGEAAHTRTRYWLDGDERFTIHEGMLIGPSVADLLDPNQL